MELNLEFLQMSGLLGGLHVVDFLLEWRKLTLSEKLCFIVLMDSKYAFCKNS